MSREIKFRAWYDGRMYKESFCEYLSGYGCMFNQFTKPDALMQFTGLRDVNGVEIYEGDIVSVPGIGKCEVKLCPHYGVVYIARDEGRTYEVPYADCASEGDYPTILGNIYEHPHLLDEAK